MATHSTKLAPTPGTSAVGRKFVIAHVDDEEIEIEVTSDTDDSSTSTTPVCGPRDKDSDNSTETITITLDSDDEDDKDAEGTVNSDSRGLIRIRDEGDGIFDTEVDVKKGGPEDYDSQGATSSLDDADSGSPEKKKRKQDLTPLTFNFPGGDGTNKEIKGDPLEELEFYHGDYFPFSPGPMSPDMNGKPKVPLYRMDPKDFAHDPQKQHKIRKAIVTYNYHQQIKAQIIMLRETDKTLRDHIVDLKAKILELANCGCPRNRNADLKVLEVNVPIVPPKTYTWATRPQRNLLTSDSDMDAGVKPESGPDNQQSLKMKPISLEIPPVPAKEDKPVPVINITSFGLQQQISPTSLCSTNAATIGSHPPSTGFTINNSSNQSILRATFNGSTPPPQGLSPASRSVYVSARHPGPGLIRPGNQSGGQQTASQLVFAAKQNVTMNSSTSPNGLPQQSAGGHPILVPLQPAAMSSATVLGPRGPPPLTTAPRMAVFITSTGKVLGTGLVTSAPDQLGKPIPQTGTNPGVVRVRAQQQQQPQLVRIKPKPEEAKAPANSPPVTSDSLKSFWSRADDDDEDEAALIASITGGKPGAGVDLRNSRKQKMVKRDHSSEEIVMEEKESNPVPSQRPQPKSKNVLRSRGMKIDLGKYADIVFEEAD